VNLKETRVEASCPTSTHPHLLTSNTIETKRQRQAKANMHIHICDSIHTLFEKEKQTTTTNKQTHKYVKKIP